MRNAACLVLAALVSLAGADALAQSEDDAVTRSELIEMLKERDAVIIQMQQRLRSLERRVLDAEGDQPPVATTPAEEADPETVEAETQPAAPSPGALAIDELASERALERSLVTEGSLLLAPWTAEFQPSVRYVRSAAEFPTTVIGGTVVAGAKVERDRIDAGVDFRLGLPWDSQFELGIPYGWVWQETETTVGGGSFSDSSLNGSGIGDLQVGLAKTLVRESGWRPDVVGRLTWGPGIGDQESGGVFLGGGFQSVGASLSFTKRQDPLVFLGSLGYETSFEDSGLDPGDTVFVRVGTALAISPETSMLFAIDNVFTGELESNGQRLPGSDTTQATLNLGLGTIIGRNLLLNVNAGIGLTEDAPDYSLTISLPIRFQTLGLFD